MTTTNAVPAREQVPIEYTTIDDQQVALTPWFMHGVPPVHLGVYEIANNGGRNPGEPWFAEWDGIGWLPGAETPEQAHEYALLAPTWHLHAEGASRRRWRGLVVQAGTTTTSNETA